MVQFSVLSGRQAGTRWVARRFPFCIGRGDGTHLQLDAPGVWDQHARLDFKRNEGFCLTALGDALVTVNDKPVRDAVLRNGDHIGLGSARVQFWLAETRQRSLWWREAAAWSCVGLFTLGQIGLLHWLLR
jgi:predicted component of type VI protein secretion system